MPSKGIVHGLLILSPYKSGPLGNTVEPYRNRIRLLERIRCCCHLQQLCFVALCQSIVSRSSILCQSNPFRPHNRVGGAAGIETGSCHFYYFLSTTILIKMWIMLFHMTIRTKYYTLLYLFTNSVS